MLGRTDACDMMENQWFRDGVWLKVISERIIYAKAAPGGGRAGDTFR